MKILLLGEYSNVHNTLAEGLRALGHEVVVASNGDFWKDFPRDIDLRRNKGLWGTVSFLWRLVKALPKLKGFDVVQIINPMFMELKAKRIFPLYKYIRRNNGKMILGAFGMDYYWVKVNSTVMPLRYSDFNFGTELRKDETAERERKDWIGTPKQRLNEYIAHDCDAINAGLYEYLATYQAVEGLKEKTFFLPFPIKAPSQPPRGEEPLVTEDGLKGAHYIPSSHQREEIAVTEEGFYNSNFPSPPLGEEGRGLLLKLFIGISKNRSAYKGTDIMLRAAQDVARKYPDRVELRVAEGVPFDEYQRMMEGSDCILDQLYSYTPAMNALLAMSKGIIVVGGGEEENYAVLGEKDLRPIVNVEPTYESCYHELEQLALHPERIPLLKQQSVEYIRKHHDYEKVAKEFIEKVKE